MMYIKFTERRTTKALQQQHLNHKSLILIPILIPTTKSLTRCLCPALGLVPMRREVTLSMRIIWTPQLEAKTQCRTMWPMVHVPVLHPDWCELPRTLRDHKLSSCLISYVCVCLCKPYTVTPCMLLLLVQLHV